jgi:hypothetical protein
MRAYLIRKSNLFRFWIIFLSFLFTFLFTNNITLFSIFIFLYFLNIYLQVFNLIENYLLFIFDPFIIISYIACILCIWIWIIFTIVISRGTIILMIVSSFLPVSFTKIVVLTILKMIIIAHLILWLKLTLIFVIISLPLCSSNELYRLILLEFRILTIHIVLIVNRILRLWGSFLRSRLNSCHSCNLLFKELGSILLLVHLTKTLSIEIDKTNI